MATLLETDLCSWMCGWDWNTVCQNVGQHGSHNKHINYVWMDIGWWRGNILHGRPGQPSFSNFNKDKIQSNRWPGNIAPQKQTWISGVISEWECNKMSLFLILIHENFNTNLAYFGYMRNRSYFEGKWVTEFRIIKRILNCRIHGWTEFRFWT